MVRVAECNRAEYRSRWKPGSLFFCLGAFRDAACLRRDNCSPDSRQHLWLQSPRRCLLFLAALAVVTAIFFFRSPGPFDTLICALEERPELIFAHFLMISIALLVLPATTSQTLVEYPTAPSSPVRAMRFRRWIFLGLKFGLILLIVFCGILDLGPIISTTSAPRYIGRLCHRVPLGPNRPANTLSRVLPLASQPRRYRATGTDFPGLVRDRGFLYKGPWVAA